MKTLKYTIIVILLSLSSLIASVTADDLRFLLDKEQFDIINKYQDEFMKLKNSSLLEDRQCLLEFAQRTNQMTLASELHFLLARDFGSMEDALQWLILQSADPDTSSILIRGNILKSSFTSIADSLVFAHYLAGGENDDIFRTIQNLPEYNGIIEATAKSVLDEISTQNSSYDALELIKSFNESYPNSIWHQAAYYYELYHLAKIKDFSALLNCIEENSFRSASHSYISSLYILGPSFRKELAELKPNLMLINFAKECLANASKSTNAKILFDSYEGDDWQNRVMLQMAKADYYRQINVWGKYGNEDELICLFIKPNKLQQREITKLQNISFTNNDRGEIAELHFWRGRYLALFSKKKYQESAIKSFGYCLTHGAPRKQYDNEAYDAIASILERLKIDSDPLNYLRNIFAYNGIIFEDTHAMDGKRYTRVALADYNNDGKIDILFNGKYIYKNLGDFSFQPHPDSCLVQNLNSTGGIWADFNKDGYLDFVSISHASDGHGDALMKQNPDHSFVKVNAKAGDVDDKMPTEGVAFVDINITGYPSLYMANYETWQSRNGYPDFFFYNDQGFFVDRSKQLGFLAQSFADNPGLAGRGVAPADFDNDGKQDIFVTNYRLNRNFLFTHVDSVFKDLAALHSVAGKYKNAYYGHSIGADWGDFDNDGDLDLIIANLAHPRFIDISDKTMLLRNDGMSYRVVVEDTLYYWQFTDITQESGIKYDELHAEPLFFDADNDGFLDIFITSVYENDRSYLYKNNGDGSFTDITYLSGARIYNGWSCAAADLNRDGLLDLVIGSGNGTKILSNASSTSNKSLIIKPIYGKDGIHLIEDVHNPVLHPNSPAFGTRVRVLIQDAMGKEYCLVRELSSAKGSSTQNAPELHFGLGTKHLIRYDIWRAKP